MNQNITKTNAQSVRNEDFYHIYIYKCQLSLKEVIIRIFNLHRKIY